MFDDNEVIINDLNKIRFSSDVFIPNDVFINFYCLVIVINYVIEKNDDLFQKFILMKDILKRIFLVYYKIMQLGIKNRLFFHPAKLHNIPDINLNNI